MIPIAAITIDDGMIALIKWALGGFFSLGAAVLALAGKGLSEILKNSKDTQTALTAAAASQKDMASACEKLADEVGRMPRCVYTHPHPQHPSTASLNVQPRV